MNSVDPNASPVTKDVQAGVSEPFVPVVIGDGPVAAASNEPAACVSGVAKFHDQAMNDDQAINNVLTDI